MGQPMPLESPSAPLAPPVRASGEALRVRLRLRAPGEHAGKLKAVTVGGKVWKAFDAAKETVDFAASELSPALLKDLQRIEATWSM